MAMLQHIGASEGWFIGCDYTLKFEIYDETGVTMEDVTGQAARFVLRKPIEGDAIVLDLTTGAGTITITGVYNADRATNTQRVNVIVTDTHTEWFEPGQYDFALKRTDAGNATLWSHGTATLQKAAL